jgi:hypothetical protein
MNASNGRSVADLDAAMERCQARGVLQHPAGAYAALYESRPRPA